jgi:hypothetical protein
MWMTHFFTVEPDHSIFFRGDQCQLSDILNEREILVLEENFVGIPLPCIQENVLNLDHNFDGYFNSRFAPSEYEDHAAMRFATSSRIACLRVPISVLAGVTIEKHVQMSAESGTFGQWKTFSNEQKMTSI